MPALGRLLRRTVDVREHETAALVASCAYFFFVLSAYYVIRPVRDEMGVAKNFNDTFVYRVGDQLGAWSYTAIAWLGLGLSGLALTMVPLSAGWLLLALWLGGRYRRRLDARPPVSVAVDRESGPA
ncbi:MAG: hypothetical protein ACREKJ_12955 [Candidatus Rokuibacteriota bacterium]